MSFYVACIDCDNVSLTSLCDDCFLRRVPCKNTGCTARLNPNLPFEFCKRCTCVEYNCFRLRYTTSTASFSRCKMHLRCNTQDCINIVRDEKQSFCTTCIKAWDKPCVRCPDKARPSQCGQLLCKRCDKDLPLCLLCQTAKIKVDAQGKSYNYCASCVCHTRGCTNRGFWPRCAYCTSCQLVVPLCNKVGKRGLCQRKKLASKHPQCNICCWAPKCTFEKVKNTDFCKECTKRYAQNGAEICTGAQCYNYTDNGNESLCAECTPKEQKKLVVETKTQPDEDSMGLLDAALMKLMRSPSTAT